MDMELAKGGHVDPFSKRVGTKTVKVKQRNGLTVQKHLGISDTARS